MKKVISTLTAAAGSAGLMLANAQGVFAQFEDDFYYDYGYETTSTGASAFFWVMWCCSCIFGLAVFAFNIWMLVHALKHAPDDQKILWVLLIFFVPFGSVIYFFAKRKEFESGSSTSSAPAETKEEK